jgi:uncharacterized protein YndB with AHSA1/START domain
MVYVKKSRVIRGDQQKIWTLINQVERYPEWMPGVVEARVTAEPEDKSTRLGRKQLLKTEMKLGKGETLQEVIAWEPPHKITWQHLKDVIDGKEITHAKEIKTTISITYSKGKITFRMIGSWEPVGNSGQSMNRIMKRVMSKNFDTAIRNLEKLIKT